MADSGYPKQYEQIDATDLNNIFSAVVTTTTGNPRKVSLGRRKDAAGASSEDIVSYYTGSLPSSPADDVMLNFEALNSKVSAYAKKDHKHKITEITILKNWVPQINDPTQPGYYSGNSLIFGGS